MSSAVPRSGWLVAKKTTPITTAISATSPASMASRRDERVGMGDTVRARGRQHDPTTCPVALLTLTVGRRGLSAATRGSGWVRGAKRLAVTARLNRDRSTSTWKSLRGLRASGAAHAAAETGPINGPIKWPIAPDTLHPRVEREDVIPLARQPVRGRDAHLHVSLDQGSERFKASLVRAIRGRPRRRTGPDVVLTR